MSGFGNSTENNDFSLIVPEYERIYKESINVSDEDRENLIKNYGRVDTIKEELGIDKVLKNNFLLQSAMRNPNEYIKNRNKVIVQITKDVDKEYMRMYNKFTKETNPPVPGSEAKKKALQHAYNYYMMEWDRLETIYPSKFEDNAYSEILKQQGATNYLKMG
eukprot:gene13282-11721_t